MMLFWLNVEAEMHRMKLRSYVGSDGLLNLQVSSGVQDADVEVEVTVTPVGEGSIVVTEGWQPCFFEGLAGSWEGEPLSRPEQLPLEVRNEFQRQTRNEVCLVEEE